MVQLKMSEEAAKLNAAYQRQWRAANKDKVAKYNKRYWEKRVAKQKAAEQQSSTDDGKG